MAPPPRPVKTPQKSGRPWAFVNGKKILLDYSRVQVELITAPAPRPPAEAR